MTTDVAEVKNAILNDPHIEGLPDEELTGEHTFPALSRIQSRVDGNVDIDTVVQFGQPPEAPDVTVIVPLYLQIRHLEVQLAAFADDPELASADLIYVLDSPQQKEELLNFAADLFPIYQLPFRVAVMKENAGFAGANNAGATLARGRLLLLLNSDILPAAPGWLGGMRDFYDSTPDIGALCPKLLYEDDSIQHAGSYFHQLPGTEKWVDAHYFKGMHRSLPAANVARAVPVVSGACMMVDRATYEELGRPQRGLRAGRLRGLGLLPAAMAARAQQLVHARCRALPPRGPVLLPGRAPAREPVQHVAAYALMAREDR